MRPRMPLQLRLGSALVPWRLNDPAGEGMLCQQLAFCSSHVACACC